MIKSEWKSRSSSKATPSQTSHRSSSSVLTTTNGCHTDFVMISWSVEAIIAFVTLLATCIPLLAYFIRRLMPRRQIARSEVGMLVALQHYPSLASDMYQMLSLETWTRIMVVPSSSQTLGYVKAVHGKMIPQHLGSGC